MHRPPPARETALAGISLPQAVLGCQWWPEARGRRQSRSETRSESPRQHKAPKGRQKIDG
ncbi:hypothetical protein PF011_g26611 [Phytophthora fragariae]|uniref:Uncharacterized protein n=1 Tax=Phytophthora fragariae TaxID=53985 RepID=A0A6A3HN41_9STRA|nr:hypothetical protein PF003_g39294 [Phytophthora fragariae]KAE8969934.1 hypothetical protein PF011_g26611 [Phytophthora fragariae]